MAKGRGESLGAFQEALGRVMGTSKVGLDDRGRPTKWPGGYIRWKDEKTPRFYLYKKVDGVPFEKVLPARTLDEAMDHLTRFNRHPAEFRASGAKAAETEPIYLGEKLVETHTDWLLKEEKDGGPPGGPRTKMWVNKVRNLLTWWTENLTDARGNSLNLRTLSLKTDVMPRLDGDRVKGTKATPNRTKKLVALKGLYSWLETKFLIEPHENIMARVATPQTGSSKSQGVLKNVPIENVEAVIKYLIDQGSIYGWALTVSAGTGWHSTEVDRYARGGDVEEVNELAREPGAHKVLYLPQHKSGDEHRTKVNERVAFAALEVKRHCESYKRGRVGLSVTNFDKAVREACETLKLPRFTPANMRHTNATYAANRGVSDVVIKEFLGHSLGSKILKKHYKYGTAPKKIPTIMDHGIVYPGDGNDEVQKLTERVKQLEQMLAAGKQGGAKRGKAGSEPQATKDDVLAQLEGLVRSLKKSE